MTEDVRVRRMCGSVGGARAAMGVTAEQYEVVTAAAHGGGADACGRQ